MAKQDEIFRRYIIPENIVDGNRFMGFKIRNIVEGVIMALVVAGLVLLLPIAEFTVRFTIICVTAGPVLFLGAIGINGDPVSGFVKHAVNWFQNRGVVLFNGNARFLKQSPVDAAFNQEDFRDKIFEIMEQRRERMRVAQASESYIEHVDFEFAADKDEADLIINPTAKKKPAEVEVEEEFDVGFTTDQPLAVEVEEEEELAVESPDPDHLEKEPDKDGKEG